MSDLPSFPLMIVAAFLLRHAANNFGDCMEDADYLLETADDVAQMAHERINAAVGGRLAALRDKLTSQSPARTRRARLRPFAVTRADFDPDANRGRV